MRQEAPKFLRIHRQNGDLTVSIKGNDVLKGKPAELFLRGTGVLAVGLPLTVNSGCSPDNAAPAASPTNTISIENKPTPTQVVYEKTQPEITEKVNLPRIVLDSKLLEKGLYGKGFQESEGTKQGESFKSLTFENQLAYASKVWGQEMKPENSSDPVFVTKFLLAYAQKDGADQSTVSFEGSYPTLKDVRFYRFQLDWLPNNKDEERLFAGEPLAITLRKGTVFTVVGVFTNNGEESALVSFSESFDRSQAGIVDRGVPRQYFAVIPEKRKSGKVTNLVSLEQLISISGGSYDSGTIKFKQDNKAYTWPINIIDAELVKKLKDQAGSFWMDQQPGGNWYLNPVVPVAPDEVRSIAGKVTLGDNEKVVYEDNKGNVIAEASYNNAKSVWEWNVLKLPTPTARPTASPTATSTRVPVQEPTRVVPTPEPPKPQPTVEPTRVIPTPEPPKPTPTPAEKVNTNYVDALSMPGWTQLSSISRLPDGSLKVTSLPDSSEISARNVNNPIDVGANGFEVIVTMDAESIGLPGEKRHPGIILVDRPEWAGKAVYLKVTLTSNNLLAVSYHDEINRQISSIIVSGRGLRTSGKTLRIEAVGSGASEVFNFYDGITGAALIKGIKLPKPFFSGSNNKLVLGMYPQSGDRNGVFQVTSKYLVRAY